MIIKKIPIEKLNPAKYNPRKDLKPGDPEYEKLKRSILEFGYVEPIVWNERTGNVVGGHQRLKVLRETGETEPVCVVVNEDETREKALNLALNKIEGTWDEYKLKAVLEELKIEGVDLDVTGFDEIEIDEMLNEMMDEEEDGFDLGETIKSIGQPRTAKGMLWSLGRHRLLCGDATVAEDFDILMGKEEAAMVFTDPPYNVNYQGKTKDGLTIQNDNMKDDEFYRFLLSMYINLLGHTAPGGGNLCLPRRHRGRQFPERNGRGRVVVKAMPCLDKERAYHG